MNPGYRNLPMPAFISATPEQFLAFNVMWPMVQNRAESFAWRMANCEADVDDLLQEAKHAFLKCGPDRYDFNNVTQLAWIHRVLRNRMCRVLRRRDHRKQAQSEAMVRAMIAPERPRRDAFGELIPLDLVGEARFVFQDEIER